MEQFQKAIRKVRQVQRMRKQRGYAFSGSDESQARVLQAYDTTRERGRYGEMASAGGPGDGNGFGVSTTGAGFLR
jgi:phospholipid-transporting ATPase